MASPGVKALLLILILGIPVLLYLFLQSFGENQYQVPVMYVEGMVDPKEGCPEGTKPHTLDHLIKQGPCDLWHCSQLEGKMVLFSFMKADCNSESLSQVIRVCNQYKNIPSFLAVTISLDQQADSGIIRDFARQYSIQSEVLAWWSFHEATPLVMHCGFNLEMDCSVTQKAVLLDPQSRIRGYYQLDDPQEIDRLVTEIAILLSN